MKRIIVHECISATSEWQKYYCSAEPHPNDVIFARELSPREADRYIRLGKEEVAAFVAEMPLHAPKWECTFVSTCATYGTEGWRNWRTRVRLQLHDLGRCLLCQITMNGEIKAVVVLLPARRRNVNDEGVLLRLAAELPPHVAEKVTAKTESDGLKARGTVAIQMMPRKRIKPEPPHIGTFERLLTRAALRWSEKRDRARGRAA